MNEVNSIHTILFLPLVSVLMLPFRPLLFFWESGSQFSTTSKRALRLTCLPVQIVPGFFPRGLNRSRCDIGHLPLSRAKVKNEWISTFAPPCVSSWLGKAQLDLYNPFSCIFLTAYWKTRHRTVAIFSCCTPLWRFFTPSSQGITKRETRRAYFLLSYYNELFTVQFL